MSVSAENIRNTLLKAAREAGDRYVHVRGVDLEAAITGDAPTKPAPKTPSEKKDR